MSNIETGGPAFPFSCQGETTAPEIYYGMTLRDYFASKAMQGLYARVNWSCADVAKRAYEQADAMLKERNK